MADVRQDKEQTGFASSAKTGPKHPNSRQASSNNKGTHTNHSPKQNGQHQRQGQKGKKTPSNTANNSNRGQNKPRSSMVISSDKGKNSHPEQQGRQQQEGQTPKAAWSAAARWAEKYPRQQGRQRRVRGGRCPGETVVQCPCQGVAINRVRHPGPASTSAEKGSGEATCPAPMPGVPPGLPSQRGEPAR